MPWKGEKDPYKIWLSEIILQQTRVEQGLNYYNRFIENFPSIKDLANAKDEEVFKLWEGLGYYTRCRNLLYTARFIAKELNGKFPDTYEDIKNLKLIYHLLRERKYTMEGAKDFLKQNKRVDEKFALIESLKKLKGFLHELKADL